jgi:hypothetical protein
MGHLQCCHLVCTRCRMPTSAENPGSSRPERRMQQGRQLRVASTLPLPLTASASACSTRVCCSALPHRALASVCTGAIEPSHPLSRMCSYKKPSVPLVRTTCHPSVHSGKLHHRTEGLPPPFFYTGASLISGGVCRTSCGALSTISPPPFFRTPRHISEPSRSHRRLASVLRCPYRVARRSRCEPWNLGVKTSSPTCRWYLTVGRAKSCSCVRSRMSAPLQHMRWPRPLSR